MTAADTARAAVVAEHGPPWRSPHDTDPEDLRRRRVSRRRPGLRGRARRRRLPRATLRAHESLYRRLNNCGSATVRVAANQLHDLRSRRNYADYDVAAPFSAALASSQVAAAEYIVQTLDALTPAERTHITDAMKLYEQRI